MPVQPGRVEKRKSIGPASYLEDFLVDHQTDAKGNVYYGKPFGYAWIRSHWGGADVPPTRTLQRHMARLKSLGRVWVERVPWGAGMRVRVLNSAKWQEARATQLPLFPAPAPVSISSGKACGNAVGKLSKGGFSIPPLLAVSYRHFWRSKEVKNSNKEKTYGPSLDESRSGPQENPDDALEARRQLLARQAVEIQDKYKTAG